MEEINGAIGGFVFQFEQLNKAAIEQQRLKKITDKQAEYPLLSSASGKLTQPIPQV
jgi:hypothetical protein